MSPGNQLRRVGARLHGSARASGKPAAPSQREDICEAANAVRRLWFLVCSPTLRVHCVPCRVDVMSCQLG